MPNESAPDYVARAFELADLVRSAASAGEASGQIDNRVTAAFAAAGFFRMMVPRLLGGGEADALTMVETIDAVSRADGAAGWTVMIGATTGTSSTQLPLEGAREIFGDPNGLVVGVVAPRGRAVRVDGGFRVTGTWPFGSGSGAANWIAGGAVVQGPEGPEMIAENVPHARMMFFRRPAVSIEDTWHVSGLRGTGSNDFLRDRCLCASPPFIRDGRAQRLGRQPRVPLPVLRPPCDGRRCRGDGHRPRGNR